MDKSRILLAIAALPLLLAVLPAQAQATRTWVSGVGDDVNPCSRTAPCKTFAGAISKTADNGEISVLDPGGYGTVTTTKSLTISGDGTLAGILNTGGINGVVINGAAAGKPNIVVTLRNLSINGGGTTLGLNGVRFISGAELHMENVTIAMQSGHGVAFEPTGISSLFMNNVAIRSASTGAVLVKPTPSGYASVTMDHVQMDGNGRGLRVEDSSLVRVRNSRAADNDANGFVAMALAGGGIALVLDNVMSVGNGAVGIYA